MEPQSEKKGRLGGKFDDFGHVPAQDVWARIEANVKPKNKLAAIFSGFLHQPNPRVWRKIAAELNGAGGRKIAAAWWWSAAAGILLFLGLGYFGLRNAGVQANQAERIAHKVAGFGNGNLAAINQAASTNLTTDSISSQKTPDNTAISGSLASQDRNKGFNSSKKQIKQITNKIEKSNRAFYVGVDSLAKRQSIKLADRLGKWEQGLKSHRNMVLEEEFQRRLLPYQPETFATIAERPKPNGKYDIQIGGNMGPGGIGTKRANELNSSDYYYSGANLGLSASFETIDAEDYSTPIVVGGFLNRSLNKRFDLGLGVVFTQMNSTTESIGSSSIRTSKIKRQYLGLAGNAFYDFVQGKHVRLYVTTGSQLDFGLGKESKVSTKTGTQAPVEQIFKEDAGIQLGFNGGMGLNYMFTKHLGIYGQGTVATFPFQTRYNLYSTKAFWPVAQVGLRLRL